MKNLLFLFILITTGNSSFSQLIDYELLDTAQVFESLEEALENPLKVYRLDLTKNKLKSFPEEILQFVNLNELILDKNRIDSIPPTISKLKNLQHISFFRNGISDITFITSLPNLVRIDFTSNYISTIPEEIWKLKKIKIIILQLNLITKIPDSFGDIEGLEELNLLDLDLNIEQQDRLINLFPTITIKLSEPCYCNYDDDDE